MLNRPNSPMSNTVKVKPNDPCPCLSGFKFKKCCLGKVDWETLFRQGKDFRPYLSLRGRNFYFIDRVLEALQLDTLGSATNLKSFKSAFTTNAVRKIHEAVVEFWPPPMNIAEALRRDSENVSGLYIGDYSPDYVKRAVVRHSIYANRILLVDPFIYPPAFRDEFNPILNPEQHRAQTLKNVNLWFALFPWIDAGIVAFIRTPPDFDRQLNWDIMHAQVKKFDESDELKKASDKSVDELSARHSQRLKYEHLVLSAPDSYLRRKFLESGGQSGLGVDEFIRHVQEERDENPDFLEPIGAGSDGQLMAMFSGAAYPSAVMTAALTGSYLFTDIHSKWREIELDRQSHSAENKVWAPFAKAVQATKFRYLNNLELKHALMLRAEGRLDSLRKFLTTVWQKARLEQNPFDDTNAILLSEQLGDEVANADAEWKKIDTDLLKWVSGSAAAGLFSAAPLVAAGQGLFLAAASVVALGAPLVVSTRKRNAFPQKFPASFFMKIDKGS
jgi:hypothetical protein